MARLSKETMRVRILDATIAGIRESGIDDVQIARIAEIALVSPRTLNRYYPEKDGLLADAVTHYLECKYKEFAHDYYNVDKDGLNGLERLLLFLRTKKDYYKNNTVKAMMFVDMSMYQIRHKSRPKSWELSGSDIIREIIVASIEAGIHDGSIRKDVDPNLSCIMISASYNGVMQRMTYIYQSDVPQEEKEHLLGAFDDYIDMLRGYLKNEA